MSYNNEDSLLNEAKQYFNLLKQDRNVCKYRALKNAVNKACLAFEFIKDKEHFVDCWSQLKHFSLFNNSISEKVKKWLELVEQCCTHAQTWEWILSEEKKKDYFQEMMEKIKKDRRNFLSLLPCEDEVFSWTYHCNVWDVKVVILGQDPYPDRFYEVLRYDYTDRHDYLDQYHYPDRNYAHGLAFSTLTGEPLPDNLRNIYHELNKEGFQTPSHGNLTGWAKQGVLLLNSILTRCTNGRKENLHKYIGWQKFTSAVIEWISNNLDGVVFLLWGVEAQKKIPNIRENSRRYHILTATLPDNRWVSRDHPNLEYHCPDFPGLNYRGHFAPATDDQGFFGCNHFLKTNELLIHEGKSIIDWSNLPH